MANLKIRRLRCKGSPSSPLIVEAIFLGESLSPSINLTSGGWKKWGATVNSFTGAGWLYLEVTQETGVSSLLVNQAPQINYLSYGRRKDVFNLVNGSGLDCEIKVDYVVRDGVLNLLSASIREFILIPIRLVGSLFYIIFGSLAEEFIQDPDDSNDDDDQSNNNDDQSSKRSVPQ